MSPNSSALTLVRQFQSETDAIRESPEPRWARMSVLVLAGMLVSSTAIMVFTRMDRVITSQGGKIVPTQQVNVFQALDTSIIRSIDVHEGQRVTKGQLLATLDPTFTSADVQQLKQQSASLEAQITRDRASSISGLLRRLKAPIRTSATIMLCKRRSTISAWLNTGRSSIVSMPKSADPNHNTEISV